MEIKSHFWLFSIIAIHFSISTYSQRIRKPDDEFNKEVMEYCSNKATYIIDGYAKSTYCYLSRKNIVYTIVKFEIKHCYKGGLQLGEIYLFEPGVGGMTEDGSGVGSVFCEVVEIPVLTNITNYILFADEYSDTTVMPRNTPVLQNHLLYSKYTIPTLTQEDRDLRGPDCPAGNFGTHKFFNVDSLYAYINSVIPIVEKQKIELNLPKKVRLQWQDTAYIRNRSSELSKSSYPKGGIDSLKEYIIQHFDWNIDCKCTTSGLNIQINIEKDGTVSNIFERFFKNEAVNKELRKLVAGIKFEPGVYKDGALIVRTVDYIFISMPEIAKQKSKK